MKWNNKKVLFDNNIKDRSVFLCDSNIIFNKRCHTCEYFETKNCNFYGSKYHLVFACDVHDCWINRKSL